MNKLSGIKKVFAGICVALLAVIAMAGINAKEVFAQSENEIVIYYENDQWNNANIHYELNGMWTELPGVAMSGADVEGYSYKYVINIENTDCLTFCFNDGNDQWDSLYGANYTVYGAGTYGVKNGEIEKMDEFKLDNTRLNKSKYGSWFGTNVVNGVAPYNYTYTFTQLSTNNGFNVSAPVTEIVNDYDSDYINISLPGYKSGTFKFEFTVEDATGKSVSYSETYVIDPMTFTGIYFDKSSGKVGQETTFYVEAENVWSYKMPLSTYWTVEKDGVVIVDNHFSECSREFKWTPAAKGTYTISVHGRDSSGDYASFSIQYTVKDDNNKIKVYYNNSNWTLANIHFGINGDWTDVPGITMQPSDDYRYTWLYVIDLGEATAAEVCFNNGNGEWDSRYGENYTLTAGAYCIVNGIIYNA